jgi:hypothetical protein
MLNLAIVFSVVLVSLSGVEPTDVSLIGGHASPPLAVAAASRESREPLDDVPRTYEALLSKNVRERARTFASLSPSMKSAVWAHHLLAALAQHPEFTSEQRAVIQLALSLLSPELYEIDQFDPRRLDLVESPVQQLTERVKAVFKPNVALELFGQLGPTEAQAGVASDSTDTDSLSLSSKQRAITPSRKLQPSPNSPTCECSTASDYCDTSGLGIYYCANIPGVTDCSFKSDWPACGTLWVYGCNGMCVSRGGGD